MGSPPTGPFAGTIHSFSGLDLRGLGRNSQHLVLGSRIPQLASPTDAPFPLRAGRKVASGKAGKPFHIISCPFCSGVLLCLSLVLPVVSTLRSFHPPLQNHEQATSLPPTGSIVAENDSLCFTGLMLLRMHVVLESGTEFAGTCL